MKIEYFYVSLEPLNIKEIWDYIWHHQAYYIKIYEQLHQKPLSLSCIETDLFWHKRYMAGCSLRLMRRPWRFLLDVILWNNTCQLLPDPRKGGRFSRSSCHLSAKAHLSLHITTWSVLTGLTGRPASLAQWEPGKETVWGHHLWCWDLIITEVMKMCRQIAMLLNKFMERDVLCPSPCFPLPSLPPLYPRPSAWCAHRFQQKLSDSPLDTCKYTLEKHTHSLAQAHGHKHANTTKYDRWSINLKWKNKPCSWEKICLSFLQQTWLFSAKVPCYQILKPYWLLLTWKSDFIVVPGFYLRFYSVCGNTSTELPGVSCGDLMWGFTVEGGVW